MRWSRRRLRWRPASTRPPGLVSERDLVAALDATHRLEQRLAAVKLSLVRALHGRGTATAQGASSTAVWLRDRLRLGVGAARRLVELAATLDAAPAGVRDALAGGAVDVGQVRVIAETVETVHAAAGAEAADKAVGVLVGWATQFDAALLRRLGTRILDRVAPDVADAAAEAALRARSRAARDRHITISEHTDGRLRLARILDTEAAAVLRAAIDPLTTSTGPDDTRTPGQRRHDALADVCRLALRSGELPENGGDLAQVVVTTSYDGLARQLGAGALDIGPHLTPEAVRRLACDAQHPAGRARRQRSTTRRRPATPTHHRPAPPRPGAARPRLRVPRLRPPTTLVRRPPHPALGRRRRHQPRQRRAPLRPPPPAPSPRRLGRPAWRRRASGVHPTGPARPRTGPPPQPVPPTHIAEDGAARCPLPAARCPLPAARCPSGLCCRAGPFVGRPHHVPAALNKRGTDNARSPIDGTCVR